MTPQPTKVVTETRWGHYDREQRRIWVAPKEWDHTRAEETLKPSTG